VPLKEVRWLRDARAHNIKSTENILHGQPPSSKVEKSYDSL